MWCVQQSVRKGCLLRRFEAGQQEGKALSRHLERQCRSIARVFGSALVHLVDLLWLGTLAVTEMAWLVSGSPGQEEEGMEPSVPPLPASPCAFWGPGVSIPFPGEAEEAANNLFHLGLNPL